MNAIPRTGRVGKARVIRPTQEAERLILPICSEIPRGNAPFTLVHAHQWEFCADWKAGSWLPETTEIRHEPGCNGVTEKGDATSAITAHARKRSIPIYNGDARLPERFRYYLAHYDLADGKRFHCLPSVLFAWIQGGRAVKVVHNRQWEFEFRESLYELRMVPPMSVDVLETHLAYVDEKISRRRTRAAQGVITQDAADDQIDELRAERERLVEAYDRQFPGYRDGGNEADGDDEGSPYVGPVVHSQPGRMASEAAVEHEEQRPPAVLATAPERPAWLEGDAQEPAAKPGRRIRPGGDS